MTKNQIDLEEDAQEVKFKAIDLETIVNMARKQLALEIEIERTAQELQDLVDKHKRLTQTDLPDKMEEIGLEEVKLKTGQKITIKKDTFVNIPKAKKAKAFSWLTEKGFDALIKNDFKIVFGKGEQNRIKALVKVMGQRKLLKDLAYNINATIHPQTLKAFVKEQEEKGLTFPEECFSIFHGKKSIIK